MLYLLQQQLLHFLQLSSDEYISRNCTIKQKVKMLCTPFHVYLGLTHWSSPMTACRDTLHLEPAIVPFYWLPSLHLLGQLDSAVPLCLCSAAAGVFVPIMAAGAAGGRLVGRVVRCAHAPAITNNFSGQVCL